MLNIYYIVNTMKNYRLGYHEKRSIVSLFILLAVYGSMFYDAAVYYRSDNPDKEILNFWGNQFLGLFLCLIVVYLVVQFVFNKINKKLTGENRPIIKDERDNAIELKAVNASHYILALGVFVAMLSALSVRTFSPIFLIIMVSFMLSGIIADVIRIVSYRRSS